MGSRVSKETRPTAPDGAASLRRARRIQLEVVKFVRVRYQSRGPGFNPIRPRINSVARNNSHLSCCLLSTQWGATTRTQEGECWTIA
jgi:hypothetical protein